MKIDDTNLEGVRIIMPNIHKDTRGYFYESFNKIRFENITKLKFDVIQDNQSFSSQGTLRGIHFQTHPFAQAKLVRVLAGEIYDVAVDLRRESDNYCKWIGVHLSAENHKQIYIPEGFGHAFLVVSSHAIVSYKVNNDYSPEHEHCIRYDDPKINIQWPKINFKLSEKDSNGVFIDDQQNFF